MVQIVSGNGAGIQELSTSLPEERILPLNDNSLQKLQLKEHVTR